MYRRYCLYFVLLPFPLALVGLPSPSVQTTCPLLALHASFFGKNVRNGGTEKRKLQKDAARATIDVPTMYVRVATFAPLGFCGTYCGVIQANAGA